MSILINGHVTMSNLAVKSPYQYHVLVAEFQVCKDQHAPRDGEPLEAD